MPGLGIRDCDNPESTKQLIKLYRQLEDLDGTQCGCFQPCTTTIYTASVMNRKPFHISVPAAQLWVYYTSKMVTVCTHPAHVLVLVFLKRSVCCLFSPYLRSSKSFTDTILISSSRILEDRWDFCLVYLYLG